MAKPTKNDFDESIKKKLIEKKENRKVCKEYLK